MTVLRSHPYKHTRPSPRRPRYHSDPVRAHLVRYFAEDEAEIGGKGDFGKRAESSIRRQLPGFDEVMRGGGRHRHKRQTARKERIMVGLGYYLKVGLRWDGSGGDKGEMWGRERKGSKEDISSPVHQ